MLTHLLSIVLTALLSSICTLGLAYWIIRRHLTHRLEEEIEAASELIREKVEEGLEEAGRELLPEFREEVREGFKQAMVDTMTGDLIDQTARRVVQKSSGIVGNLLFGKPKQNDS